MTLKPDELEIQKRAEEYRETVNNQAHGLGFTMPLHLLRPLLDTDIPLLLERLEQERKARKLAEAQMRAARLREMELRAAVKDATVAVDEIHWTWWT